MSLVNPLKATATGGTPRTRMFRLGLRYSWWCCFYRCRMSVFHSHWFLAPRDRCLPATLLNIFAHLFVGRHFLLLPILMSHIGVACVRVRGSICATRFPPFPLENVSRCLDVIWVVSLPFFSIRHCIAPYSWRFSPFPSSAGNLKHLLVLLLQWPCLGAIQ